jgi:hypothetical protein
VSPYSFFFSISKESIVDVFATVKTVEVPVEGCSQKSVELHVKVGLIYFCLRV